MLQLSEFSLMVFCCPGLWEGSLGGRVHSLSCLPLQAAVRHCWAAGMTTIVSVPAGTRNSVKVSTLFVCEAPSPLGTWVTNIASVTVKFLFNCCLLVIPIVIPICSHCLCPSVTGRGGREEGRGASYLEFKSQQMLNHYTLSVYNNHSQITSNIAYKSNKYDILLSSSNYVILN